MGKYGKDFLLSLGHGGSFLKLKKNRCQKVLIIGLDMGDGNLIRRWAEQGHLPILNRLLEQGTCVNLRTPAEVLHVSAWPSLYTGTLPGEHGVYYTFQVAKGHQTAKRIGIGQYGKAPIWKILSQTGKRCIVMDAPYTFPEEGYNGVQIFEWGTWAWYSKPMAMPAELWDKLKASCGAYPLGYEANQIGLGALHLQKLRDRLILSAASKGNASVWLLSKYHWDFAWVVFGETHPAGHYLCHTDNSEFCCDVYKAIDSAIGRILNSQKNHISVFVVSGDRVGPNHAGWHLLPEILKKTGYLVELAAPSPVAIDQGAENNRPQKDRLKKLRNFIPQDFRQMVSRKLPSSLREKLMARWASSDVDWSRTRAYCLPTDLEGCIRINLKGREPKGIVESGEGYIKVCEELSNLLSGLINSKTNRPVVKSIYLTHQVFAGDKLDDLPDIVVHWNTDEKIDEITIPGTGTTVEGESPDKRTGTHMAPGFVLACDPSISRTQALGEYHVIDFAPTLLRRMGVSIPEYMQGRVWDNIG